MTLGKRVSKDDAIDLLKTDSEGHECDVLDGAQHLLSRCSPGIVIEVNKNQCRVLESARGIVSGGDRESL